MLELIPKTNIDFVGKRYVYLGITGFILLSGLISLIVKKGPKWGLDFTGGTILEVKFQNPHTLEEMRKILHEKSIPPFEIQSISGANIFIIRTQQAPEGTEGGDIGKLIQTALEQSFPNDPGTLLRKEF